MHENAITRYSAATTRNAQLALLDELLLDWADTSGMARSLSAKRHLGHFSIYRENMGNAPVFLNLKGMGRLRDLKEAAALSAIVLAQHATAVPVGRERRAA